MIELYKDRMNISDDFLNPIFLIKGRYEVKRVIEGLGWMVYTNLDMKYPKMTLIRYEDGELV